MRSLAVSISRVGTEHLLWCQHFAYIASCGFCLQTLFVQRLREAEAAGDAAGDAAGSSAEPTLAGLPQKDLLSWYFDKMVERYKSLCFMNTLVLMHLLSTQNVTQ